MSYKKRPEFYGSEKASMLLAELHKMEDDPLYDTPSTYTANSEKYPTNRIAFSDKHMEYIHVHPNVDPLQYLANLRILSKKRA